MEITSFWKSSKSMKVSQNCRIIARQGNDYYEWKSRYSVPSLAGAAQKQNAVETALIYEEPLMVYAVYAAIGVLILFALLCARLYVRHDRSCAFISTTEWVRLMRKNDIQYDRATNAKPDKSGSS
jgi:hypothetical protein